MGPGWLEALVIPDTPAETIVIQPAQAGWPRMHKRARPRWSRSSLDQKKCPAKLSWNCYHAELWNNKIVLKPLNWGMFCYTAKTNRYTFQEHFTNPEKSERNVHKYFKPVTTFSSSYEETADIGTPSPNAWGPDLPYSTVPTLTTSLPLPTPGLWIPGLLRPHHPTEPRQ